MLPVSIENWRGPSAAGTVVADGDIVAAGGEVAGDVGIVVALTAGLQAESMSEPDRNAVSSRKINRDCILVNIFILRYYLR
jgi:hypothetical protein